MCFEIMDEDFRFRYHHPLPNFYKVSNPANPKTQIDNSVLKDLEKLAAENNCAGISYSKLSDDFRKEWNIDFDNVIIFKYLMSPEILEMNRSKLKCKLIDDEFQEIGRKMYGFADFLRKKGFGAELLNPLDDKISLRAIAMQSNDAVITRSNMCLFKEGLNIGFFMIHTSIENLPFKQENDMCWVGEFCKTCGKCIRKCPENAFDENELVLRKVCTAHREGCSQCMLVCPFYKKGYIKIKQKYDKRVAKKRG